MVEYVIHKQVNVNVLARVFMELPVKKKLNVITVESVIQIPANVCVQNVLLELIVIYQQLFVKMEEVVIQTPANVSVLVAGLVKNVNNLYVKMGGCVKTEAVPVNFVLPVLLVRIKENFVRRNILVIGTMVLKFVSLLEEHVHGTD
jgi:hypothetical protein